MDSFDSIVEIVCCTAAGGGAGGQNEVLEIWSVSLSLGWVATTTKNLGSLSRKTNSYPPQARWVEEEWYIQVVIWIDVHRANKITTNSQQLVFFVPATTAQHYPIKCWSKTKIIWWWEKWWAAAGLKGRSQQGRVSLCCLHSSPDRKSSSSSSSIKCNAMCFTCNSIFIALHLHLPDQLLCNMFHLHIYLFTLQLFLHLRF